MNVNYKTLKSQLPYDFRPTDKPNQIQIVNVKGQSLLVTRDEIEKQLARTDLDVHRRRMYEAAKAQLDKARPS